MIYVTTKSINGGVVWSCHRLLKATADKARYFRRRAERLGGPVYNFDIWEIRSPGGYRGPDGNSRQWQPGDTPSKEYWTYKYGEINFTERIDQIK